MIRMVIILCLLAIFPALLVADDTNPYDWESLFKGDIFVERIEHRDLHGIRLSFTLQASRDYIWNMLTEPSFITLIYPDCDEAAALVYEPDHAVIRYWIKILFTGYQYTLNFLYNRESYKITWTKADGDFKEITGFWEICPTPRSDTSLVISESFVESGFPVPRWFEDWIKMIKSKDLARDFRKWIAKYPDVHNLLTN